MSHYRNISVYLNHLVERYKLHICVKDFCGFIPINKELDQALRSFLAHTNPFCMYIKQDVEKYRACISLIRKMFKKCGRERKGFYGVCHAGLWEYVVPIVTGDIVMGSINIGFFQADGQVTEKLIRRCCRKSELLRADKAIELYRQHITPPTMALEEVLPGIKMLAEYLGNAYQTIQMAHRGQALERPRYHSSEDTIISDAVEYIHQMYGAPIAVGQIAKFCHCSESYLSRIFKRRMGVNINVYINKVRVELSKNYLLLSSDSISAIALSLGFNDPNYFSRVFTGLIGYSPTEFRRRFREESLSSC